MSGSGQPTVLLCLGKIGNDKPRRHQQAQAEYQVHHGIRGVATPQRKRARSPDPWGWQAPSFGPLERTCLLKAVPRHVSGIRMAL